MKQCYLNIRKSVLAKCSIAFLLSLFLLKVSAQPYVNGNLTTGPTTSNGTAAPAGFNWSEVQTGNGTAGLGGNIAAGFGLADNFVVTAGQTWNVTKFTFYGYSTGYAGATSPFTDVRVRIFNTNPSVGNPAPIFGDLTTNRFLASSTASMYRIFNATAGTTRQIWKVEATVNTTLAAGNYWVEFQLGSGALGNFTPPSTFTGTTTQPGNNALQHTIAGNTWAAALDGVNPQDLQFQIDYTATGASCSGGAPGATNSTHASVCPETLFTLTAATPGSGTGLTYRWQSSPNGTTWTDIPGGAAQTSSLSLRQAAATWYRLGVTCSGNTQFSTALQVPMSATCYCVPGNSDCSLDDYIANVTFATINNTSACGGASGYSNYTTTVTAPTIEAGSTLPIAVRVGPGGTEQVAAWIDYNQNGNFEASEFTFIGTGNGTVVNGSISIPATALTGTTRMRVRVRFSTAQTGANACTTYTFGETEDYNINIVPCVVVNLTAQPANRSVMCGANTSFSVTATGTAPLYQWEFRTSPTAIWQNVTNGGVYSGATTATLNLTSVPSSMNGYQYRVIYSGGCRATDFSSTATLTVTPLLATVNTPAPNVCIGTIVPLSITNIDAPSQSSQTFNSGALTLAIPDNNPAGATNSIAVSGVPAGAQINGISVSVNIPHTWAGDLVLALRAPDGSIFNLDYYLTGTGGAGVTTGLINTVISSAGTAALSTGSGSYTGTFRADGAAATAAPPSGPTGFIPTVTTFAGLYSSPANGNWTLGIYDGGNLDVGTLTSWSITLNYLAGAASTGIFTPVTGLYTDPAATVAYTGTAINTVYANPSATTTYSLVVTTPTCVSDTLRIPVTINNPITGTSSVSSQAICDNGNVSFTATAPTSGNNIAHRWQVSTNGGASWTNLSNTGVYSGATTSTLSITGASTSMNGYRYRDSMSVAPCSSSLLSGAGTLTVHPNPALTLNSGAYSALFPGLTTTLGVSSTTTASAYTWYLNGVPVSGANASTLPVTVDGLGTYSVMVEDVNGCSATSAGISIRDSVSDILYVYPSPSNGPFNVRYYSNTTGARTLNVFDNKGARVYTKLYTITGPYTNMPVDIVNLSRGIYTVELADRNGKRIKTGRILIQ
ncbi:MAG: GEVED domain-containing protein [Ferruginibacter sp.]